MMYAQYCRLESKAGGVTSSTIDFVRACHSVIKKSAKGRKQREARHAWIRDGLQQRIEARQLVRDMRF